MSNRRRPTNPTGPPEEIKVDIPMREKSVHKRVPAVIHFSQVDGTDREDDEVIGTAIIYEDGTSDIIVNADISREAKLVVGGVNAHLDGLSMNDEED